MSETAPPSPAEPRRRLTKRKVGWTALGVALAVGVISVVSVLTGGRVTNGPGSGEPTTKLVGERVASFTLPGLGQAHEVAPWRDGHPAVLIFFASWCVPCRGEMPKVAAYLRAHTTGDVVVLGVDEGDSAAAAKKFVAKDGVPFAVGLDHNYNVASGEFGFQTIPETVFVSAKGVVTRVYFGAIPTHQLAAGIAKLQA